MISSPLGLVLLYLVAAVAGVVVCRMARLPPMLGYLAVGVLIGPNAAALATDTAQISYLAEFGVVFLMFVIGLEFNLPKLRSMRQLVFGLGLSQVYGFASQSGGELRIDSRPGEGAVVTILLPRSETDPSERETPKSELVKPREGVVLPPVRKVNDTSGRIFLFFVDDINLLELFTCTSGANLSGYCDADYDRLIERARSTPDDADRHQIYARAEAMLTGPRGALPVLPTYWVQFPTMREPGIEGWRPNPLGQYDFTKVSIAAE